VGVRQPNGGPNGTHATDPTPWSQRNERRTFFHVHLLPRVYLRAQPASVTPVRRAAMRLPYAPIVLSVLCSLLSGVRAALPPLSYEYRIERSSHVFVGTVVSYKQARLLSYGSNPEELWKGTDVDPTKLTASQLSASVDRSTGHVWETQAVVEVEEWLKGGPGPVHTVRYRKIALPMGMVGPTGQYSTPNAGERYRFFANEEGGLIEPNGFEKVVGGKRVGSRAAGEERGQLAVPKRVPEPLADADADAYADVESFTPPKLKHSRRGGFTGGEKLVLTRRVSTDECPWLDSDLPQGQHVYVYRGHTYGVVGPAGLAVSRAPPDEGADEPFFELPRDAVALHNA